MSKFFRVKKTTRRHAVYRNENRTGIRFDWRTKNGTLTIMQGLQKLNIAFFRTEAGNEPVREWLRALPAPDRKEIGDDIRTVQFGWPLGMPLVEKLAAGLWEVRTRLDGRIARVIFTVQGEQAVLLHGFIKKSRRISKDDMETAKVRLRQLAGR